jgi:hypothetical protein
MTALKKPELAQRGSHTTQTARRGVVRGSKFLSFILILLIYI